MRITTQMLNETAGRAGTNINRMSLLDVLDSTGSCADTLQAKKDSQAVKVKKSNYEDMEDSAAKLKDTSARFFLNAEELFNKASESGDTKEIVSNIEEMVSAYNESIKNLRTSGNTIDLYYLQKMEKAVSGNEEQLKALGITQQKDGALKIDSSALGKAKPADLEAIFGEKGSFSQKIAAVAEMIEDNAAANLESLAMQYNAGGSLSNNMEANKYNFWG